MNSIPPFQIEMKLLYDIQSGTVLGCYSQDVVITPSEGQALIDVPSTIPIPQAIVKVIVQDGSEIEFIIDQSLIDNQWRPIKELRAQKLRDSDWTCSVTDYTPPNKADWIAYRQALRDLTQQPNPFEVQWPISPNEPIVVKQDAPVPVVSDPVVSDPVVSDPVVSDPVVSEPVVSDPVVSDPVVSDPVISDPAPSDTTSVPVVSDPVVSDPVVSEPVVSDPVVSEPVPSDNASVPVVSDPVVSVPVVSDPAPSDPALPVVSEPIPSAITESATTESATTESATTESATTETSAVSEPAPSSS